MNSEINRETFFSSFQNFTPSPSLLPKIPCDQDENLARAGIVADSAAKKILEGIPEEGVKSCRLLLQAKNLNSKCRQDIFRVVERQLSSLPDSGFTRFLKNPQSSVEEKAAIVKVIYDYKDMVSCFPQQKRNWLHFACETGDHETLAKLHLSLFVEELNNEDAENNTPSILALKFKRCFLIKLMMIEGVFWDCEDPKILDELYLCIVTGRLDLITLMLEFHSYSDHQDAFLDIALQAKQPEVIKIILGKASSPVQEQILENIVNKYGNSSFFLDLLSLNNHDIKMELALKWIQIQKESSPASLDIIEKINSLLLVENLDTKKNLSDLLTHYVKGMIEGQIAWDAAARERLKLFVYNGAFPLKSFIYCLDHPDQQNSAEISASLTYLLKQEDLWTIDNNGIPLFTKAIRGKNPNLIKIFIDKKVSPFISGWKQSDTPFFQACYRISEIPGETLSKLFEMEIVQKHGFFQFAKDFEHYIQNPPSALQALKLLCKIGCDPCYFLECDLFEPGTTHNINVLLNHFKIDLTYLTPRNFVPEFQFETLLQKINQESVEHLSQSCCSFWRDRHGNTLFHYLANNGMIELLLKALRFLPDVNYDARNHIGKTFLEIVLDDYFEKAAPLLTFLIEKRIEIVVHPTKTLQYDQGTTLSLKALQLGLEKNQIESHEWISNIFRTLITSTIKNYSNGTLKKEDFWNLLALLIPKSPLFLQYSDMQEILTVCLLNFPNHEISAILLLLHPLLPSQLDQFSTIMPIDVNITTKKALFRLFNLRDQTPPIILDWLFRLNCLTKYQKNYLQPIDFESAVEIAKKEWNEFIDCGEREKKSDFIISLEKDHIKVRSYSTLFTFSGSHILLQLSFAMFRHLDSSVKDFSASLETYNEKIWDNIKPGIEFNLNELYITEPNKACLHANLNEIHPSQWLQKLESAKEKVKEIQDIEKIFLKGSYCNYKLHINRNVILDWKELTYIREIIYYPSLGKYIHIYGYPIRNFYKTFTHEDPETLAQEILNVIDIGDCEILDRNLQDFKEFQKNIELNTALLHLENIHLIKNWIQNHHISYLPLFEKMDSLFPDQISILSLNLEKKLIRFNVRMIAFYHDVPFEEVIPKLEALQKGLAMLTDSFRLPNSGPFYTLTDQSETPVDLSVPYLRSFNELLIEFDSLYHEPDKIQKRMELTHFIDILEMKGSVIGGDGASVFRRHTLISKVQKLLHLLPRQKKESKLSMLLSFIQLSKHCLPRLQNEADNWLMFFEDIPTSLLSDTDRFIAKGLDSSRRIAWNSFLYHDGSIDDMDFHWLTHLGNSVRTGIPMVLPADLSAADQDDMFTDDAKDRFGEQQFFGDQFKLKVGRLLLPTLVDMFNSSNFSKEENQRRLSAAFLLEIKKMIIQLYGTAIQKQELQEAEIKLREKRESLVIETLQKREKLEEEIKKLKERHQEALERYSDISETLNRAPPKKRSCSKKRVRENDLLEIPKKRIKAAEKDSKPEVSADDRLSPMEIERSLLLQEIENIFAFERQLESLNLDELIKMETEEPLLQVIYNLFDELNLKEEWLKWNDDYTCQLITPEAVKMYLEYKNIIAYS